MRETNLYIATTTTQEDPTVGVHTPTLLSGPGPCVKGVCGRECPPGAQVCAHRAKEGSESKVYGSRPGRPATLSSVPHSVRQMQGRPELHRT